MGIQFVNVREDGTGDTVKTDFEKINKNIEVTLRLTTEDEYQFNTGDTTMTKKVYTLHLIDNNPSVADEDSIVGTFNITTTGGLAQAKETLLYNGEVKSAIDKYNEGRTKMADKENRSPDGTFWKLEAVTYKDLTWQEA